MQNCVMIPCWSLVLTKAFWFAFVCISRFSLCEKKAIIIDGDWYKMTGDACSFSCESIKHLIILCPTQLQLRRWKSICNAKIKYLNFLTFLFSDLVQVQPSDANRPRFVAVTSLEDVQAVRCAEFHPNGSVYAIGSNSKTFRICEYPPLSDIRFDRLLIYSRNVVFSFVWLCREEHSTYQATVLFKRTKHHKGSIYCMAWSPQGDLIATGSNDKTVKLMRYNDDQKQLEGREVSFKQLVIPFNSQFSIHNRPNWQCTTEPFAICVSSKTVPTNQVYWLVAEQVTAKSTSRIARLQHPTRPSVDTAVTSSRFTTGAVQCSFRDHKTNQSDFGICERAVV